MSLFNIELYSMTILVILLLDYISKFKGKFNTASRIWLSIDIVCFIISVSNLVFSLVNIHTLRVLALVVNLVGTITCSLLIYVYIKYVYINRDINLKKEFTHSFISIISCIIFTLFFTFSHQFGYEIHSLDKNFFSRLLPLAIVPNGLICCSYIYHTRKNLIPINLKIVAVLVITIIALLLDQHYESLYFVSSSFTLTTLMIYINKHEELLNTDPLTGLSNKRALESFIKNIKPNKTIAAYSIDINKFKYINDTYGHLKGDFALKKTAEILRYSSRASDLVIRNGGDEFLILAVIKKEEDAIVLLKRIEDKMSEYNKTATIKISLSTGFDTFKTSDNTTSKKFEDFLKKIDSKMYEEKEKYHKSIK